MRQLQHSGPFPGEANSVAPLTSPAPAASWGAEELAATLDAVGACVWAVDLAGRCVFINQAASQTFGYSQEACLGRRVQCLIHRGLQEGSVCPNEGCQVRKAIESGSAVQVDDDVFRRCDGTLLPVRYSVQPLMLQGVDRGSVVSVADISAQKRAEDSQRKSDEWLRFAQNAAGVGVFDLDLKTGEAKASEGQYQLFGLDPGSAWPSLEEWRKLVHPEDREGVDRQMETALSGSQPAGLEYRIFWPDGSVHWLFARPMVIFDEAGRPARLVGVNVDVTSRIAAETALTQVFSESATPMAIWGFDGRIQRTNPSWEATLGFTAAEREGQSVFDYIHPEDCTTAAAEFESLLVSGRRIGFECRAKHKDGSHRWLLMSARVAKDAHVIYVSAHDITKRKVAEDALRESEVRFRSAFENALFGAAIISPDGRYLQVNQRFCDITGYTKEELLRTDFLAITHPDDKGESLTFHVSLSGGRISSGAQVKRYVRKNGTPVWVKAYVSQVEDGGPVYRISLIEDLTEQKRAEEAAHRSEEWLRFTLDAAGVGLCYKESEVTRVSEHQFRLYGLDPAETWISRERWLQLIHADDRERVQREQNLALEQGEPYDIRFRVGWPDGSVHWLLCQGKTFNEDGEIRKAEVTIDITERKRALAALANFIAISRSPIAVIGFDGRLKQFNAALPRISGFTAEELNERPASDFFHPEDRPAMEMELQRLITQGGHAEFECRGLRKDGSIVWMVFSAAAAPDEKSIFTVVYDITERKAAEAALAEEALRRRTVFEQSRDGIVIVDRTGKVCESNRSFARMLGYSPEEILQLHVWDWDTHITRDQLLEVFRGTKSLPPTFDARHKRKDGSLLDVEVGITCVEFGGHVFHYAVHRDITARKRAEEELQFQNILLSTQQEASIDGILVVDENARILSYNRRFIEMWGIPPKLVEEGIDEPILQFVAAQLTDPLLFSERVNYLYEHRRETSQEVLMLADGRIFDRYSAPMFGSDERYYGRVWYLRDITEGKRAEEALRQSERRFKLIAETIDEVFWMNDADLNKVIYVSPAYERVWGRPASEAYEDPRSFLNAVHPDDKEKTFAALAGMRAGDPFELEFRIVRPDGTVVAIWDHAFPVLDAAGKLECYVGIAQDITERKQMEDAIQARSEELARSNQELDRFAYVASHDLQEPLRMVSSFTQLLSKKYSGKLDETADRYIHFAVDGAKRMQQLINDLLAYSRVNSKNLELGTTECEAVVRAALLNVNMALNESGAEVTCDPLPVLMADRSQLGQLFQNLIGNAIKFRGSSAPRIHISVADRGANWLFSVRDNGIGIEPRHAERIFEVFQRLHGRAEYPGTGIGLAVCKKVVERHGGRIWVESEPGAGSAFLFTLPKGQAS